MRAPSVAKPKKQPLLRGKPSTNRKQTTENSWLCSWMVPMWQNQTIIKCLSEGKPNPFCFLHLFLPLCRYCQELFGPCYDAASATSATNANSATPLPLWWNQQPLLLFLLLLSLTLPKQIEPNGLVRASPGLFKPPVIQNIPLPLTALLLDRSNKHSEILNSSLPRPNSDSSGG